MPTMWKKKQKHEKKSIFIESDVSILNATERKEKTTVLCAVRERNIFS